MTRPTPPDRLSMELAGLDPEDAEWIARRVRSIVDPPQYLPPIPPVAMGSDHRMAMAALALAVAMTAGGFGVLIVGLLGGGPGLLPVLGPAAAALTVFVGTYAVLARMERR